MAKETKIIGITIEDYDYLKRTLGIYKSIVGLLMMNIKSDDGEEHKYSYKRIGDTFYCDDPNELLSEILNFVHYFDPRAYAVITGRAIEITPDMLHDLAEMFSDDEEEEGEEVEGEA